MFKKILSGLVVLSFCVGCDKTVTMKDKLEAFKEVSNFMKEQRMAGSVSLHINGDGKAYQEIAFGLDTGIDVQAHLQFNGTQGSSDAHEIVGPPIPDSQPSE